MTQRPGSSTATLVGSQAFFNGALAVTVICLGRWLQREELGLYFYALSLGSLLEILVHWGAQHYVNREAAARFDEARELLPSFLWLSALSVTVVTFGLIPLHGWPVALTTAAALIRAGAGVLGAIFIGRRQVWPTVLSRVASQVLLLTGLWLVVRGRPSLAATSILLVAVAIVHIGIQLGCLPRIGMTMKATIAEWPGVWRRLVRPILPFVLLFFLGQFHYRADAVLIEWLAGLDAVSVLMLAFKWVEGVFFVPAVVASAAIPYLTSSLDEEERLTRMLKAYTFALAAGLMCLSVVLLVAGGPALTYLLGGAFEASIPFYRLLVWSLPLQGLGFFFATALIVLGRERDLLVLTAAAVVAGIAAKSAALLLFDLWGFSVALLAALAVYAVGTAVLLWRCLGSHRMGRT